MATTAKGLRYPVTTDSPALHTDLQNIASDFASNHGSVAVSAKGDILVHNGTVSTALAVGTAGQVLSADSSTATGLKWVTPSLSQSVEVITSFYRTTASSTASFTSTSLSFTNIPQSYRDIELDAYYGVWSSNSSSGAHSLLINGGTVRLARYRGTAGGTVALVTEVNTIFDPNASSTELSSFNFGTIDPGVMQSGTRAISYSIRIDNYASTAQFKNVYLKVYNFNAGDWAIHAGVYEGTAAVTAVALSDTSTTAGISMGGYYQLIGIKGS